jgi:hypothetical protein
MLFKSVDDIKFRNKYKLFIGSDGEVVTTSEGVTGVNLPAESNQRMINDNTERVCVRQRVVKKFYDPYLKIAVSAIDVLKSYVCFCVDRKCSLLFVPTNRFTPKIAIISVCIIITSTLSLTLQMLENKKSVSSEGQQRLSYISSDRQVIMQM